MERPEDGQPAPTEIDLTKTEGAPTAKGKLQIALKAIGLNIHGSANMPGPQMIVCLGILAVVTIMLGTGFAAAGSQHELAYLIWAGGVSTLMFLGTFVLALLLDRARRNRPTQGGEPPRESGRQ